MPKMILRLLALLLLAAPGARAAESAPFTTARDTVSLVSESDTAAPGRALRLGLRFKLAPGWHTYWSNPGDAGAPPTIDITGATAGPIAYPAPERLRDGPFTSYAYTGEVLLPLAVTAPPGPFAVTAHATWLVCATVCVPEEASFQLALPSGPGTPGAQAALFAAADARTPRASPFPAQVTPDGTLVLAAPGLKLRDAAFFPAEAGVIDQGAPQRLRVLPDRVELGLKPLKPGLGGLAGVLRLTDSGGETALLSVQARPVAALPAEDAAPGLAEALLLAFAGGLLLNLMPCVLPVLAMKALALARLSGAARGHVRREAAAYTLGVVVAFCAIGGATLAIRALGGAAGWGVQFQSAPFTAGMAMLLLAIGLNFSGVFVVGGGLAGAGQGLAARGSFFTGLLAVVVATPCAAPFMGAALAAALAMPPAYGMLVFVVLGLGLAAPYGLLALAPRLAGALPRPGAWMNVLKQLLAFPMYAAALWMVWVASQQTGAAGQAAVLAGLLLTGFAAWAYGTGQLRERARVLNGAALAALACVCLLLAQLGAASPAAARSGSAADGSQPFSPARLAAALAAHHPVLVDMSAAWCVTCLVNERVALAPQAVRDAFAREGVVYLRGDWTRQDSDITEYLRGFGRSGVPLYVVYGADGHPAVLPQLLTPGIVLAALR
jgi:thiol:disulfide interchange protein DsbD